MSQAVLPFYIVVDTSSSMRGARIDAVNAALPRLHRTISANPVAADKCHIGVISFNTTARVVVPLTDLSLVTSIPTLMANGQTNFGDALTTLGLSIGKDVARLKASGARVHRPCAFFLTDGRPTGGWRTVRDRLVDQVSNSAAPNIVAFGVAEADETNLRRLATRFVFLADDGVDVSEALSEIFTKITMSIVQSAVRPEAGLVLEGGDGLKLIDTQSTQCCKEYPKCDHPRK